MFCTCGLCFLVSDHWSRTMWFTYSHRAGVLGSQGGFAGEEGCFLSKQCAPSLAFYYSGSERSRSKEVLWQILRWSHWPYQWVVNSFLKYWIVFHLSNLNYWTFFKNNFLLTLNVNSLSCRFGNLFLQVFDSCSWCCWRSLFSSALRYTSMWNSKPSLSHQKTKRMRVSSLSQMFH